MNESQQEELMRSQAAQDSPRATEAIEQSVKGCPNAAHMGEHACKDPSQCWEPCGELGKMEEHVWRVARSFLAPGS